MTSEMMNTPSPEFRARLESDIARAYRRETRLGAPRQPRHGRLRAAGLLAICIAVGAVSGIVSAQARDFVRRDSLLDAARAELELMAVRLELARAQLEDASRRAKIGALDEDGVAVAETELRSMETRAMRARLNIDEIGMSSQPARDELNAPLVGGRDFVTERIQLDLTNAQQRLGAAERALGAIERRVRAGAESELALGEAQLAVTRTNGSLAALAQQLSLRREFVEKGTPAEELARRLEVAQLRQEIRIAQQAMDLARARAANVERHRAVGAATELDELRARVEVGVRELELSQLITQLRRVEREPPT
jgi:hypothetical protein